MPEKEKQKRSGIKDLDDYIESLEAKVLMIEANSIFKLIIACDEVAGIIADDIRMLKENGDDDEIDNKLHMMGSKKSKIYQRYREVISDIKHFKTIYDISSELKSKTSPKEKEAVKLVESEPKKRRNIQDFVTG